MNKFKKYEIRNIFANSFSDEYIIIQNEQSENFFRFYPIIMSCFVLTNF